MRTLKNLACLIEMVFFPSLSDIFYAVGLAVCAKLTFDLISWILFFFGPSSSLSKYGAGKGAWAVVTGSSEGIGYVLNTMNESMN